MRAPAVVLASSVLVAGLLAAPVAAADQEPRAAAAPRQPATYTNPVSSDFADTYADPAVVRGQDGWWYAVGTTDPLREGEGERHLLPLSRSADLVTWEYVGDAFPEDALPVWADTAAGASLWAPDLRFVDGEWRLYYVVTETTVSPQTGDSAIGMATAPSPTGPWTDSGAPVVAPRPAPDGGFLWTFDPTHVTGPDGTQYLYYGSYFGGIEVIALDDAGRTAAGPPTQVAVDNAFEGAYVLQRDGWWYLFASSANCCAGPVTGYSVRVARSDSPTGPFVDREGNDLTASRTGATPVLVPNGNRWVGTGHNAVVTDLAGQDWIVYHAIDRADPYLDGTDGINERPMLIDRLDWVDGWPTARAGLGASETSQVAPAAAGAEDFADGTAGWDGEGWIAQGGAAVSTTAGDLVRTQRSARALRVEADVRGAGAGVVAATASGSRVRATVLTDRLAVEVVDRRGRVLATQEAAAPGTDPADWHALVLTVADGTARAEVSDARLGDPAAVVDLTLPRGVRGSLRTAGATADAAGAEVTDVSASRVAEPVRVRPERGPGRLDRARSTEFDRPLDDRWVPVCDPQAQVRDGALHWPVEQGDLSGPGGTPSLLLQDPPPGDWTVETVVDVSSLGTDEVRNFQQGGVVARLDDDQWVRLSAVAIWNTRQVELGVERPYAGRVVSAGTIVGPPGERTWLRLQRSTNDAGEVTLTGWSSQDGTRWVRGGTWTLPPGSQPQVGLAAHGATAGTPPAEVSFEYLRWYRTPARP